MSKKIDYEMRRTSTKPEPKVADTKVTTPEEDWLTDLIKDLKATKKELDTIDPKLLKEVQDKLHEHNIKLEKHDEKLDDHESRITKLEKATAAASASVAASSTAAPVVAAVGASAPTPVVVSSDYDKLYPKTPTPHHVTPAYYVRLGNGNEVLRYLEADAIRIANTEELGASHTAICVSAWADENNRLIRPLTADESYRFRKL